MAQTLTVSTGEYLDRLAILWIKTKCFYGPKRHECAKRFYSLERTLKVPDQFEEVISSKFRDLVDIHQDLFDAEDDIRLAADNMPSKEPGSTKGWYDAAISSDAVRLTLLKHMKAANDISKLNADRHAMIAKIDEVLGDAGEPKQYLDASESMLKMPSSIAI